MKAEASPSQRSGVVRWAFVAMLSAIAAVAAALPTRAEVASGVFAPRPEAPKPDEAQVRLGRLLISTCAAISRFAQKMGCEGFDWQDSNQIFEEAARHWRGGVLNYYALAVDAKREGKRAHEKPRELGTTGMQTPIRVIGGELVGTPKLHDPANDWGEIEDVTTDQKWLGKTTAGRTSTRR